MRKYEIQLSDDADKKLIKLQESLVNSESQLEPYLHTHLTPDVLLEAGLALMFICSSAAADLKGEQRHMLAGFIRASITVAVTKHYPDAIEAFLDTLPPMLRDIMRIVLTDNGGK